MQNATSPSPARGPQALDLVRVPTDETRADLEKYVALLKDWSRVHNLLSREPGDLWTRHIADSLQLLDHAPPFKTWVDLGSGAGFPGMVVALANKRRPDRRFILVEASQKKAAFLRAVIRETGAQVVVASERIEKHAATMRGSADVISARALARVNVLCGLAQPYMHANTTMLLLKGQDFVHELEEASKSWDFDVITSPSVTDPGGQVVAIRSLRAKSDRR